MKFYFFSFYKGRDVFYHAWESVLDFVTSIKTYGWIPSLLFLQIHLGYIRLSSKILDSNVINYTLLNSIYNL